MNPEILYEDTEIIVCVKPAGIPTQSKRIGTPDMETLLKNHIVKTQKTKTPPYLAVIHRLDQPVTGLLVFAKTPAAAKELNRQLQTDGFGKYYRAWLAGEPPLTEGDLTDYLLKNGRTISSSVCTADTPGAKKAELHYHILKKCPPHTLVEITLKTGRHHQIRVQMSHLGCPIAGDCKYGDSTGYGASGLQLFACHLVFQHPRTKKKMEFFLDDSVMENLLLHNENKTAVK